jgi:hypothetical protein
MPLIKRAFRGIFKPVKLAATNRAQSAVGAIDVAVAMEDGPAKLIWSYS